MVASLVPELRTTPFMTYRAATVDGVHLHISRSGYTGEDGVEISIFASEVVRFCDRLLADERGQADWSRRAGFPAP